MIVISPKTTTIESLYGQLAQEVDLKDLGDIDEFLGIKITRNRQARSISLDQSHYIEKTLAKYGYKDNGKKTPSTGCPIPIGAKIEPLEGTADPKAVKDYQQAIGTLMYLPTKTRPDLAFPVGQLARYMANPGPSHSRILDKVWKYLENMAKLGLAYYHSDSTSILGYVDSDWGGDIGTRRSTTGYIFKFLGSPISWSSKLQKTVALSSCEAEYMAIRDAIKEQQYIRGLLSEIAPILGNLAIECLDIYTDSNSAIELAKNPGYHARTKHVDIQYHFVRECIQKGVSQLKWTSTSTQLADGLTKAVSKWTEFIEGIGLRPIRL